MGTITRVFEFDCAHRVMNEKVKCFNLHGHRFKAEVTLSYSDKAALGYATDFKELKRILGDFIDRFLDHACLLNPEDLGLITMCSENKWRLWIMGLGHHADVNPSAENIASELFYIFRQFFPKDSQTSIEKIRLYETPNCWVEVTDYDYEATESFQKEIMEWRNSKGTFNYDIRTDI